MFYFLINREICSWKCFAMQPFHHTLKQNLKYKKKTETITKCLWIINSPENTKITNKNNKYVNNKNKDKSILDIHMGIKNLTIST